MTNEELTLSEQFMKMGRLLMSSRLRHLDDGAAPELWRKRLLGLIKAQPGLTAAKLTELLRRRTPAGEEVLLGLEKKGYIELASGDGPGERVVTLTELGQKEAAGYPAFDEAFDVLGEDEQATMRASLSRVLDELERQAAEEDGDGRGPEDGWFPGFPPVGGSAGLARMRKMHALWASRKGPGGRCRGDFESGGTFGDYLWDMRSGM
jgi:DNA-binding MarR family transcriptional regulator